VTELFEHVKVVWQSLDW